MRTDEPAERGRVKRRAGLKAAIVGGQGKEWRPWRSSPRGKRRRVRSGCGAPLSLGADRHTYQLVQEFSQPAGSRLSTLRSSCKKIIL